MRILLLATTALTLASGDVRGAVVPGRELASPIQVQAQAQPTTPSKVNPDPFNPTPTVVVPAPQVTVTPPAAPDSPWSLIWTLIAAAVAALWGSKTIAEIVKNPKPDFGNLLTDPAFRLAVESAAMTLIHQRYPQLLPSVQSIPFVQQTPTPTTPFVPPPPPQPSGIQLLSQIDPVRIESILQGLESLLIQKGTGLATKGTP